MKNIKAGFIKLYNPETGKHEHVEVLQGESAYQAAVRLGKFTGTEEQWVEQITNDRAAALTEIENNRASAVAAIQAKGEETLATIPEDYTDLINSVSQLSEENGVLGNRLTNIDGQVEYLPMERGTYNATNGVIEKQTDSKDVRTSEGILVSKGDVIKLRDYSTYKFNPVHQTQNGSNNTWVWKSEDYVVPYDPADGKVYVIIAGIDDVIVPVDVARNLLIIYKANNDTIKHVKKAILDINQAVTNLENADKNIYDLLDEQIAFAVESGNLSADGMTESVSNTYIRSADYIALSKGVYQFTCPSTQKFYLHRYGTDGNHLDAPLWGVSGNRYRVETADVLIRFVVGNVDGTDLQPEQCELQIRRLATKFANGIKTSNAMSNIIHNTANAFRPVSSVLPLESGTIDPDHITPSASTKIMRAYMFMLPVDITLYKIKTGYEIGCIGFDADNNIEWSGWKNTGEVMLEKDKLYSVLFTKSGATADYVLTADEVDSAYTCGVPTAIPRTQYMPSIKAVSHQGNTIIETENHNKIEGYINAAKCGFTVAETDLKYTSDGVLVCCHDNTFVDGTSGEEVSIPATKYADLLMHNYYGGKIATFEEVVTTCELHGMKLLVDQIGNTTYANAVINVLNKLRAWSDVILIVGSGSTDVGEAFLSANETATIAVISSTASVADMITFAGTMDTGKNKVIIAIHANQFEFEPVTTLSIPAKYDVAVWTVDDLALMKQYAPYVNYYITNTFPSTFAME